MRKHLVRNLLLATAMSLISLKPRLAQMETVEPSCVRTEINYFAEDGTLIATGIGEQGEGCQEPGLVCDEFTTTRPGIADPIRSNEIARIEETQRVCS